MGSAAVMVGLLGVAFGVFVGLRWTKLQAARKGYAGAKAAIPKAKAARKAARGAYWVASRAMLIVGLLVVAVIFAMARGSRG
ncbi:hypothetical protein [Hamadaea tsunoensis]|uniref:hypothetical protein n=1 Tax=Hamadaea tsunoensis TaxID=53368 RepID=UPI000401B28D|nr:hypothetical protein [Hamadaea tsunoensis]